MPRYFFHVRDQHYLHEDCEGIELPDLFAALAETLRADRELAGEMSRIRGLEFEITDTSGTTLLKVPIRARRSNSDLPCAPWARNEEQRGPARGTRKLLH